MTLFLAVQKRMSTRLSYFCDSAIESEPGDDITSPSCGSVVEEDKSTASNLVDDKSVDQDADECAFSMLHELLGRTSREKNQKIRRKRIQAVIDTSDEGEEAFCNPSSV